MEELFDKQISKLKEPHFHLLCWVAKAEGTNLPYNITNAFDDLKQLRITRTKQNVVSYIESLEALCFVTIAGDHNRKNLFITRYGARALEQLVGKRVFSAKKSPFLEGES